MPPAERQSSNRRPDSLTTLTPDRIERRSFSIEPRGYDRDEVRTFLFEVAAALRLSMRSTNVPVVAPKSPTDAELFALAADDESAEFDRTSAEVAKILRAAEFSAATRQEDAETMADAILEQAHQHAEDIRRQAATDTDFQRDRARQLLVVAQERADALVAEAEAQAQAILSRAKANARRQGEQLLVAAHERSDELAAAEQSLRHRLHAVRVQLSATISALDAPAPAALIDLTDDDLDLRTDDATSATSATSAEPRPTAPPSAGIPDDAAVRVRAAVEAAMHAARGTTPSASLKTPPPNAAHEPATATVAPGGITAPVTGTDLVAVRPSVNRRLAATQRNLSAVPPTD